MSGSDRSSTITHLRRSIVDRVSLRLNTDEPGQALIMVSVMMFVLIGFVALATDTGLVWMNRRSLQNAADAAALAGVQNLPNDTVTAQTIACDYAATNAITGMMGKSGDCNSLADVEISEQANTIKVTVYKEITPIFGMVLGFGDVEIGASATAVVGSLGANCPFPIFQTPDRLPGGSPENMQFYTLTAMKLTGGGGGNGNYLLVDVGNGADAVLDAMVSNSCDEPIGPEASTEPGNKVNKALDGFKWRIHCASGQGSKPNKTPACPSGGSTCPSPDITNYLIQVNGQYELSPGVTRANCTRLVILPIFPGPFPGPLYNGKTDVIILGYAIFYIAGACDANGNNTCSAAGLTDLRKGDAWGYYVRMATPADQFTDYNGFGTKVFALVD